MACFEKPGFLYEFSYLDLCKAFENNENSLKPNFRG